MVIIQMALSSIFCRCSEKLLFLNFIPIFIIFVFCTTHCSYKILKFTNGQKRFIEKWCQNFQQHKKKKYQQQFFFFFLHFPLFHEGCGGSSSRLSRHTSRSSITSIISLGRSPKRFHPRSSM